MTPTTLWPSGMSQRMSASANACTSSACSEDDVVYTPTVLACGFSTPDQTMSQIPDDCGHPKGTLRPSITNANDLANRAIPSPMSQQRLTSATRSNRPPREILKIGRKSDGRRDGPPPIKATDTEGEFNFVSIFISRLGSNNWVNRHPLL